MADLFFADIGGWSSLQSYPEGNRIRVEVKRLHPSAVPARGRAREVGS